LLSWIKFINDAFANLLKYLEFTKVSQSMARPELLSFVVVRSLQSASSEIIVYLIHIVSW